MLQSNEGTRNFKLAVASTDIKVIKDQHNDDLSLQRYDHRRLTKQIVENEKIFEPKRIYTEGVNLNKTFYKGRCLFNLNALESTV